MTVVGACSPRRPFLVTVTCRLVSSTVEVEVPRGPHAWQIADTLSLFGKGRIPAAMKVIYGSDGEV